MSLGIKDKDGNAQLLQTGSGDGSSVPFRSPAAVGIGAPGDTGATDSSSSWSVVALLKGLFSLLAGTLVVRLVVGTTGGATPFHLLSQSGTNSTQVKSSAGQVFSIQLVNRNTGSCAYVKLYDKATAPVVGTDVPKKTFCLPAAVSSTQPTVLVHAMPEATSFALGIGVGIVAGTGADSDSTGVGVNDVTCDLNFK